MSEGAFAQVVAQIYSEAKESTVDPRYLDFAYLEVKIWKSNICYQNIMGKRRNCSQGAISPLFHNIFNISFTSGVKLYIAPKEQFLLLLFSTMFSIYMYLLLQESNYIFICE